MPCNFCTHGTSPQVTRAHESLASRVGLMNPMWRGRLRIASELPFTGSQGHKVVIA